MGCTNCSTGNGVPNGCKSNGACGTSGCDKLEVYDWLANVELPNGQSTYDILEVRFKNSRKSFYRNLTGINFQTGDAIVVEASPGYDVGVVSVAGELARIQVRKKTSNFKPHEARKVIRKATSDDLEKWKHVRTLEQGTMYKSRELASQLALQMKISDIEFQGDGGKATFYYTAEDRIDFRQLIKDLADQFKVRVEMKQIGARQEAARIGGIGSCGRELCCTTWMTDFRSVSTAAARYQQLSLNPQKLAGQCGKLKCCLNYELDSYIDALKKFPSSEIKLQTQKGVAFHVKTDVFKEEMWYIHNDKDSEMPGQFVPLTPERVKEIIKMNEEGTKPTDLKEFVVHQVVAEPDYTNVVGQDSLSRFDSVFKRKKKKKKKGNTNPDEQRAKSPVSGPPKVGKKPIDGHPKKKGNQPQGQKKKKPEVKANVEGQPKKTHKKKKLNSNRKQFESKNKTIRPDKGEKKDPS